MAARLNNVTSKGPLNRAHTYKAAVVATSRPDAFAGLFRGHSRLLRIASTGSHWLAANGLQREESESRLVAGCLCGISNLCGHGLVGIGDRVTALGGWLPIENPVGEGTRVAAVLPIRPRLIADPDRMGQPAA
jgi:hypothetical protein